MRNKQLIDIFQKAKKELDNTIFPKGTSEYNIRVAFYLNKFELNALLEALYRLEELTYSQDTEIVDYIDSINSYESEKLWLEEKNEKLENAINQAVKLLYIDGQGTKQKVIKLLKEVLDNE